MSNQTSPQVLEMVKMAHGVRSMVSLYPQALRKDWAGDGTGTSLFEKVFTKEVLTEEAATNQSDPGRGRQKHPFNWDAVLKFKTIDPHHSACIDAKVHAMVGLGFHNPDEENATSSLNAGNTQMTVQGGSEAGPGGKPKKKKPKLELSKVDEELNPLCSVSFLDVVTRAGEDYASLGNGFMEVVRKEPKKDSEIVGLHHLPAVNTYVFLEGDHNFHYEVLPSLGGTERKFARFGDLEGFLSRNKITKDKEKFVSEVIHFPRSSSLCRYYGYPDWLAAVASIELVSCLNQHMYDYFNNRGVPEFMLFLLKDIVDPKDWAKVEKGIQGTIGQGNQHKTMAFNFASKELEVQIEKLGMAEGGANDFFGPVKDACSLSIVSAHRTPPTLAGIQIPGKLGASNEVTNAMALFQALVIGPSQKAWEMIFASTLGNQKKNGGLTVRPADFILKTLLGEVDMVAMNTQGKMRQSSVEAKAQGRDLKAGVKKHRRP